MYNNTLQDSDLQNLHKKFKLNLNMFLTDILDSDLFQVEDKGNIYQIIPLFYCDSIETDGDAKIIDTYVIYCRKDYTQIFMFISENNIETEPFYTITNNDNIYTIFIYQLPTLEPCRNYIFSIDYGDDNIKQLQTDKLGYCIFESDTSAFEVIL